MVASYKTNSQVFVKFVSSDFDPNFSGSILKPVHTFSILLRSNKDSPTPFEPVKRKVHYFNLTVSVKQEHSSSCR